MQVDLIVVLLRIYPWGKVLPGVSRHEASFYRALDGVVELFDGGDTDLFTTILGAPDRQGCTPVAATREVPVLEVLQPLTEATRTGALGLPVDGIVETHHLLTASRGADEPAIQRIIEYGLVRTPAVGIGVHVLLDLEGTTLALQLQSDRHI